MRLRWRTVWVSSVERWLWLVVTVSVSTPLFLLFLVIGFHSAMRIPLPDGVAPNLFLFGGATISTSAVFAACSLLRPRLSHFRELGRYPPLAIAVIGALTVGWVLWAQNIVSTGVPSPGPELEVLSFLTGVLGCAAWIRGNREPRKIQALVTEADDEVLQVIRWSDIERPAQANEPDLFGGKDLAKRLGRVLTGSGREQAVALVGRFGSGKSTVLERLKEILTDESNPRIWFADVSCWGLESSQDAPKYILEGAIEGLDHRIDTHCLRGLPEAYQRLVSGSEVSWQENLGLRQHWTEVVRSLERLLDAANARLILLIEDSDRHDMAFDPHHIARLLDELRRTRNITYVLAVDDALSGIDLGKSCDHVFQIPSPDESWIRTVLGAVRTQALKWPFVDVLGDKRHGTLTVSLPTDPFSEAIRREFGGGVVDALAQLVATPRQAKHVARAVMRSWNQLAGEIDLDDLIVLMVLRETEPAVYEFLYANRREARRSQGRGPLANDQGVDMVKKEWTELLESRKNRNAIEQMVEFLQFARFAPFRVGDTRPQGVGRDEGSVDYFRRIFEEKLQHSEVPDQSVLKVIDAYEGGNRGELLSRLVEQHERGRGFLGAWEDLSNRHPPYSLLRIASEVLERLRQTDGPRAIGDHEAILSLWRRANRRIGATPERDSWLSDELRKAVRVSLDQANTLYCYWASLNQGSVGRPGREAARTAMIQEFKAVASDSGALAAILSETNTWALTELRAPADQTEMISLWTEPSAWSWLTPVLIELLGKGKLHLAEQVTQFFGRRTRDNDPSRLEVDEELLRAIAAENTEALLAAIVQSKAQLSKFPRFLQQAEHLSTS